MNNETVSGIEQAATARNVISQHAMVTASCHICNRTSPMLQRPGTHLRHQGLLDQLLQPPVWCQQGWRQLRLQLSQHLPPTGHPPTQPGGTSSLISS